MKKYFLKKRSTEICNTAQNVIVVFSLEEKGALFVHLNYALILSSEIAIETHNNPALIFFGHVSGECL